MTATITRPRMLLQRTVSPTASGSGFTIESLLFGGLLVSLGYILLLDGYLRLSTGKASLGVARDIVPAGLVLIGLAHLAVTRKAIPRLPLFGILLAWVIIVVAQLFNPDTTSVLGGLPSLRPHLEFVAFFFIAAATLKTRERLRTLLLVLSVCTAINGGVALYQSGLTPDQQASWGPGYAALLTSLNPRSFADPTTGQAHLRPTALGNDAGFAGILAMLTLPGSLALAAYGRGWRRLVTTITIPLSIIGVVSSQTRAGVVGAVCAVTIFVILASLRRGGSRVVIVAAAIALAAALGGSQLLGGRVTFERYSSIAPTRLASTFSEDRGGGIPLIGRYITRYPFGAGIGSAGPATGQGSSTNAGLVSGENEFLYMLVETGIPGLVVMLALFLGTLRMGLRVVARAAGETRLLLIALVAGVGGTFVLWSAGGVTSGAPSSPFFWITAGCVAGWGMRDQRRTTPPDNVDAVSHARLPSPVAATSHFL